MFMFLLYIPLQDGDIGQVSWPFSTSVSKSKFTVVLPVLLGDCDNKSIYCTQSTL